MAFVRTCLWKALWQKYNILKWYENSHTLQKSSKWSDPMIPLVKSRPTQLHACSFWRWYPLLCRKSPSSDWYLEKNIVYFRHKRRCCCRPVAHVWWGYILLRNLSLSLSLYLTSWQSQTYRQPQKIRIQNIKHGQTERKIFLPTFPSTRSVWEIYRTFYLARTCFQ